MNTVTVSHPAVRSLALDPHRLLVIANRPGTRIKVLSGRVWLTEAGRPGDHFAHAGEELRITGHGRTIVEALGRAQVQLSETPPAWRTRLQRWRDAIYRDPHAWVARTAALALAVSLSIGIPELLARGFHRVDAQATTETAGAAKAGAHG